MICHAPDCSREIVKDDEGNWKHKDGRVKHAVVYKEEQVTPRQTTPTTGDDYAAIVPENENLVPKAEEVFEELGYELGNIEPVALPTDEEITPEGTPEGGTERGAEAKVHRPGKDKMVTVRGGGLYLPARQRISWMRGEPQPRPEWTIDTYAEEIERGKFVSNNKVEGGYARYRANIFDDHGRLIGTGTKTEWSERFMDFAEKAETGAIARALAVCGFGTEMALDIDEGIDQDRIADAPVDGGGRPIQITPSNVQGLVQGGRSQNITKAQINEVTRLIGSLNMGVAIVPVIEAAVGRPIPDMSENPTKVMKDYIEGLSFTEAGNLIQTLNRQDAE
jgi:hypothetical protein